MLDLCSPAGHEPWIVAERILLHIQEIQLDFFPRGKVTRFSCNPSDCIPKLPWLQCIIFKIKTQRCAADFILDAVTFLGTCIV